MIEDYKEEQRKAIIDFLKRNFNIELTNYEKNESLLNSIVTNIGALKIWQKNLKQKLPEGPVNYINEIISNLNHVLIMSPLGLKTPSLLMIRRSQENLFSFLYYKDHPIEFFRKENEVIKKNQQIKINELKEYIEDYPFSLHYDHVNLEEMRKFIKQITEKWQDQYKHLSNFVHGTNSEYLDLVNFLEEIEPSDEFFSLVEQQIIVFSSVINSLLIIFFFEEYKEFKENEKRFIRFSINNEFNFKNKILYLFGEV